ncbi:MAG TPA: tRNA (uridine(54)-C5)-methyltransferase TrmA, partial [Pseudomonas sp.]|nr:tRNA (uridine(54)-C5)-methyltransferase TrmA [Pseudomonas sp.]
LTRRFERILYISCNPETLAQNIAQLHDTHRIERCALFDQFPYTHHMESGVLLVRR